MSKYKDIESEYKIYVTRDYDRFKLIDKNRSVKDGRIKKLQESIKSIGLIPTPLLVNENYEVIDGQGRLKACSSEALPIYYLKIKGLGIKHCRAMNINQSNWTMRDYIYSYAKEDMKPYVWLKQLLETYGKSFNLEVILYAADATYNSKDIKDGLFKMSYEQYRHASVSLSWLLPIVKHIKRIPGRISYHEEALLYCYDQADINNDRLKKQIEVRSYELTSAGDIPDALKQIETVYNHRLKDKVLIEANYRIRKKETTA